MGSAPLCVLRIVSVVVDSELNPYAIAAFVAATAMMVITRERSFLAWRDMRTSPLD